MEQAEPAENHAANHAAADSSLTEWFENGHLVEEEILEEGCFEADASVPPSSRNRSAVNSATPAAGQGAVPLLPGSLFKATGSAARQPVIEVPVSSGQPLYVAPSYTATRVVPISHAILDDETPFNILPITQVPRCETSIGPSKGNHVHPTEDILGWDSQHPYILRWARILQEEHRQNVLFHCLRNDSSRQSLCLLLCLQKLFIKQLPNMTSSYITRLLFDPNHESFIVLRRTPGEYEVIGGCCYRPFVEQRFAEIAFLAVWGTQQVRGYGARLMDYVKERAKQLGLTHLLTCADNNAVPYFVKQGFSTEITLPQHRWCSYVKEYNGVTLMECVLLSGIDYLNVPMLLKAQKMCVVENLKQVSASHIVHPGIDARLNKGISLQDIPSVRRQAGFETLLRRTSGKQDQAEKDVLHAHLRTVLEELKKHECAWPFLHPVDVEETGANDYYDVIKNPMDLSTMEKRLDDGWFYVTKEIFIADFNQIVANCIEYNGNDSYITEMALKLRRLFVNRV